MEMHVSTYELGGDVYTVVIIHDITKRKQAEHYLQGTLDSSLNGIMAFRSIRDDNDNIIDFEWLLANKMSEKIVGRQERDLIGKHLTVEMPGTLETGLFDFYVQVAETGEILEHEHHYAHESIESWFHTVAIKMDDGVAVTFADISEQRLITLAEQEQRTLAQGLVKTAISLNKTLQFDTVLKVVLANIKDFVPHDGAHIVLLDQEQLEIQVAQCCDCYQDSPLAQPLLNIPEKLASQPPLRHMTTTNQALLIPDTSNHLLWSMVADHSIASFLGCPILIDQKPMGFLVLVSKTANFFTPQHQVRLQAYAHQSAIAIHNAQLYENVQTQLEQLNDAQALLVQREKLAAIGELSAGIAHELNNPLTGIILYSQLLEMQSAGDAKVIKDINQIVTQAKRASSIVHGLLNFARQHPMERNPLQINEIINRTIDLLAYEIRAHNVDLQLQLDEDLPLIIGDTHQLQQVLVNLINNALQAQQDNGKQGRIVIKSMTGKSEHNHSAIQGDVVQLTVQDDGPGIPPDVQKRIFDPFFTTKATGKGTGLGLSICHGIIKEHNGYISVESVVGQGTIFCIELPVTIPAVAIPMSEPTPLPVAQHESKQRLLFIDDDEDILTIVGRMLNRYYEVDVATNAQTALHKVAANSYDLLICDVHMPDGDGLEFYARWQQEQSVQAKSTQFLFITGDVINLYVKKQLENLNVPFLVKPFGIDTLLKHIQTLLPDG